MTVLTKPDMMTKKEAAHILSQSPVIMENGLKDELDADVLYAETSSHLKKSASAVMCMGIIALVVASVGLLCGLEIYQVAIRPRPRHYTGFCSIPVELQSEDTDDDATQLDPNIMMPLQWSVNPLEVYISPDRGGDDDAALREEVDIGVALEKILVFNGPNGRFTTFIHDFNANISGIVDSQRCFMMAMNGNTLLSPDLFVLSIQAGAQFDVTRVRNFMQAVLPPLPGSWAVANNVLAEQCKQKITYRLEQQLGRIRKRSTDPIKEAHYAHFAGKHVQEIAISNLDEIIAYEQGLV